MQEQQRPIARITTTTKEHPGQACSAVKYPAFYKLTKHTCAEIYPLYNLSKMFPDID